jgi:hypothetical protein
VEDDRSPCSASSKSSGTYFSKAPFTCRIVTRYQAEVTGVLDPGIKQIRVKL